MTVSCQHSLKPGWVCQSLAPHSHFVSWCPFCFRSVEGVSAAIVGFPGSDLGLFLLHRCLVFWAEMSVISLCVCKKRWCFRFSGRLATQDMPSCHGKTKQLCVSVSLCRSAAYLHHSHNSALHPRHHKRPVPFQLR